MAAPNGFKVLAKRAGEVVSAYERFGRRTREIIARHLALLTLWEIRIPDLGGYGDLLANMIDADGIRSKPFYLRLAESMRGVRLSRPHERSWRYTLLYDDDKVVAERGAKNTSRRVIRLQNPHELLEKPQQMTTDSVREDDSEIGAQVAQDMLDIEKAWR